MKNVLEVNNLNISVIKTKQPIVKNISFDVKKGSVLGIIGESGCGKTMTCKAMMRLLREDRFAVSGSIKLCGSEILDLREKQMRMVAGEEIAMIMQNPMTAFHPSMKIGSHIVETLRAHMAISKKDAYLEGIKVLGKMNLCPAERVMNSYPHTLSGGMLQRVMIAIALMLRPSVVIADEATTALDVSTQALILNEFKRIRDKGISLVVVTHDFGVIAKIADDVIVMKDGGIVESGTVFEVFYKPKSAYTRELLAARLLTNEGVACYG